MVQELQESNLNLSPGNRYIFRQRSNQANPIKEIFGAIYSDIDALQKETQRGFQKPRLYQGEMFLLHAISILDICRYGTYGNYNIDYVHPVSRENNWKSRNLVMAGNFNLTNVGEVFSSLVEAWSDSG